MNNRPLHEYIVDMLDYADELKVLITPQADVRDRNDYFMTLVYVEDVLDSYGRNFIPSELSSEVVRRMDALRDDIRSLVQQNDFDAVIQSRGEKLFRNWHKI